MRTDHQLKQDVEHELRWEPSVTEAHVGVSANQGIVTLSGHVPSYTEKYGAESAAKRVFGVLAVANELDVKLPFSNRRSDEDIAVACVAALKAHAVVPHQRIQVLVTDGWVTLEGTVEWRYQKEVAERAVRDLIGVLGITNTIALKPRLLPGDVKHVIEAAFKRSAELDAKRVSVETHDGKVILHGKVRSFAALDAAERAAWSAPGVTSVICDITVSP